MDQRSHKLAIDAAEWDVVIGWSAGIAVVALRAFALLTTIFSSALVDRGILAQIAVQLVLAAIFTYFVYRRRVWAAIALLVVWGVPYFYSWYAVGRMLPPLGIIGILVWYGLYRGLRGVRALAGVQEVAPPSM